MHAYDFILVLFSFVYAAAITHILSVAGEIIIASKRIRFSWLNAGWMCAVLLFTCAWWIGLWDLHTVDAWSVGSIAFSVASGIYLNARLVSPRIPEKGEIDLRAFHLGGLQKKYQTTWRIITMSNPAFPWLTVRRYEGVTDTKEAERVVKEGFVPLISKLPGFISYYWTDAGNNVMISVSVYTNRESEEETNRVAADFVKQHMTACFRILLGSRLDTSLLWQRIK